jgi:hypothetical protein
LVIEGGGDVLEACELFAFHFLLLFLEHGPVEGLFVFEEVPEDAGQFMSHGGDGFLRAQSRLPTPEKIAK